MNETTVTRGSQITLTKKIREEVGIREGDRVMLSVVDGRIIVDKRDISVFDNFKSFLPSNFEEMLKKTKSDHGKRLQRLGIVP